MPNIKIKLKVSGAWQQMFPETRVDQIIDAGSAGKALLKKANPGATSFAKVVNTDGVITVDWRTPAQMLSDLGAAPTVHTHDVDDVTGLVAALAAKADLSGGVIVSSQIPSFVTGGLKFKEAISTTTLSVTGTWLNDKGIAAVVGNDNTARGTYFIITNAAGCDITLGAGVTIDAPGDEGVYTGTIHLEVGDWLVFKIYESSTYKLTIINNTYQKADTANYGIVRISDSAATVRGALADSVSAEKVIDEKKLRDVMKDIYYADTEAGASTAINGDLLFEY